MITAPVCDLPALAAMVPDGAKVAVPSDNCGVAMTILYTWVTPEHDPADREDWFGIHSPACTDTPDVRALTVGLRAAAAGGPTVAACAG